MATWGNRPPELRVRAWRSGCFRDPVVTAASVPVLSVAERATCARLPAGGARADYLAAHLLMRTMLADLTGDDPARIRFRRARGGRPRVVGPAAARGLRFSLSRADGIVLCAVAEAAVGADVESARRVGADPLAVAETCCGEPELEALRALPPGRRVARLLDLWTLKEAIAKAIGPGVRHPLARIDCRLDGDRPAVVFRDAAEAARWQLVSFRIPPHHVAAVAVRRGPRSGQHLDPGVEAA